MIQHCPIPVFIRRAFAASILASVMSSIAPNAASAGEWLISPTVSVKQSATDNARSVENKQEADMFTTTTAGIGIVGNGRRVQLDFNYDLSKDIFWDNSDLNTIRHSLLGAGNVELWEDHIFVDTRASVTQQSLARSGGATASDRGAGTNDQSMIINYSVTPNFAHRYGNWAESDLIVRFSEVRFQETDTGAANAQPDDSRTFDITTLLRSGRKFSRTKWEIKGERSYSNDNSDRESMEASGEYAWSRHIDILARMGQETIDNAGINADNSAEIFWRGGVGLTPARNLHYAWKRADDLAAQIFRLTHHIK
jgi:uncharacterized protein (PEP-CTERM system associated)